MVVMPSSKMMIILLEPCNLPQLNNFIVHLSMHHRTKWSGQCVRYHLGNETS
jgi:hypothetical protein